MDKLCAVGRDAAPVLWSAFEQEGTTQAVPADYDSNVQRHTLQSHLHA